MRINAEIQNQIEDFLHEKVLSVQSIGGGCIAQSVIIQTQSHKSYFLKTHSGAKDMFFKEANGLNELTKAELIRVPSVILASPYFLMLEHIATGIKRPNFFTAFGTALAAMHAVTSKSFGFYEDNYIGATPQLNLATEKEKQHWPLFYYHKRLLPQFRLAEKNGYATGEISNRMSLLEAKIESILYGSEESPALLHGDLWGGNYMCDEQGNPVLIDPAVYYGHREADLAMTRMFGGFSDDFYLAYEKKYPLQEGWQQRQAIYLLYHQLNHLNLFGRGYFSGCIELLQQYT